MGQSGAPGAQRGASWDWESSAQECWVKRDQGAPANSPPPQWTAAFTGPPGPCSPTSAGPCRAARPARPRSRAATACRPSVSPKARRRVSRAPVGRRGGRCRTVARLLASDVWALTPSATPGGLGRPRSCGPVHVWFRLQARRVRARAGPSPSSPLQPKPTPARGQRGGALTLRPPQMSSTRWGP